MRVPPFGRMWVKKSNSVPLGRTTIWFASVCEFAPVWKIFFAASQLVPPLTVRANQVGPVKKISVD
jgi:hypothetical protein